MLVQFSFKNFLSFKEENTIDMTAINAYKEHEYNLIDLKKEKFLRVAAIYGANASGKSNFILAYDSFRSIVIKSSNNVANDEENIIESKYCPFGFDEENIEYQIISIIDDNEYKYGFEFNEEKIASEWLYKKDLKTNRTITIFEREGNEKIKFGASVRKECEVFGEQVMPETLVLSFFYRLKNLKTTIFKQLYYEITEILACSSEVFEDKCLLDKFVPIMIDKEKQELLEFFDAIDTGIKDIYYEMEKNDPEIYTVHKEKDGKKYELPLYAESEGTIKCIAVYMFAKAAIRQNKVLFIDELNSKLHPLLLKFIVDLFYNKNSTAQLIYTTHDTTLLDKKFFRRDQLWFVQKDEFGCSQLYALSDFKVRSDASFEKDYLSGVYGGIPLLKDFEIKG